MKAIPAPQRGDAQIAHKPGKTHGIDGCQFPAITIIKQWFVLFLTDPR
jgi:hypothetical protein